MDPKPIAERSSLTRRRLLQTAVGTGLLLLLPMLPDDAETADTPWVPVGNVEKFPLHQPQRVTPLGRVLFITRMDETTFSAVSAKCTHKGCEVFWNKAATQFSCPCHGAAFATDGANLHGPRSGKLAPLPPVQVRETAGQVEVNFAPPMPVTVPSQSRKNAAAGY